MCLSAKMWLEQQQYSVSVWICMPLAYLLDSDNNKIVIFENKYSLEIRCYRSTNMLSSSLCMHFTAYRYLYCYVYIQHGAFTLLSVNCKDGTVRHVRKTHYS